MAQLFQTILCPFDFDDYSKLAVAMAARLAGQDGAVVCLLHVLPIAVTAESASLPMDYRDLQESSRARVEQSVKDTLGTALKYRVEIRTGIAAIEITAMAQELKADVIVMATHGRARSTLGHLFLGSVAEQVVRAASCPILVVPPK